MQKNQNYSRRHSKIPVQSGSSSLSDFSEETALFLNEIRRTEVTSYEDRSERPPLAHVQYPPKEDMTVYLGSLNSIERINEYQSDENLGFSLIGLFLGAALGMVCDWAITNDRPINPFACVLFIILLMLSGAAALWLKRIHDRKNKIQKKLPI